MDMIKNLKICCIKSEQEIVTAVENGATCLGFVSKMPSGPGIISDQEIKNLISKVPSNIRPILLTSVTSAEKIIEQSDYCGTDIIQIVKPVTIDVVKTVKQRRPEKELIIVIHITGVSAIERARMFYCSADKILLDTGDFNSNPIKLGGTGEQHDWNISKKIIDESPIPVYLAGGLKEDNIIQALETTSAKLVDICSGLRINDKLDGKKVREFTSKILRTTNEK